ncbi:MAG: NAD(P)/FAD-dependent oxidoreductase [Oscillospiraceae bacterium]
MLIINSVKLPLDYDFSDLTYAAAKALKTDRKNIKSASLFRKSVDARHKNDVHFCCSLLVSTENDKRFEKNGAQLYSDTEYIWKKAGNTDMRPVVAGFGPAGMFAALALARAGMRPLVLERGQDVDTRIRDVENFFAGGALNTESNVQFGEGGAGTFSDGKLNTGIKDSRCREILKVFVSHGAPEKILTDAKPHIGTDILSGVVKSIRNEITALGGEVRFGARLDKINRKTAAFIRLQSAGRKFPAIR